MSSPKLQKTNSAAFEAQNVHEVYDQIAEHFDSTRYKAWPIVEAFLRDLPTSQRLGLDAGCGNGKYVGVNPALTIVGCDMCEKLLIKAAQKGAHCVLSNAICLPFRDGCFDFVISIAVIHHLSTAHRRLEAVCQLLRCMSRDASGLIFVWAHEQTGKRQYNEQDSLVSWNLKETAQVYMRYYHFFAKGELDALLLEASAKSGISVQIINSGYDCANWYVHWKRL